MRAAGRSRIWCGTQERVRQTEIEGERDEDKERKTERSRETHLSAREHLVPWFTNECLGESRHVLVYLYVALL